MPDEETINYRNTILGLSRSVSSSVWNVLLVTVLEFFTKIRALQPILTCCNFSVSSVFQITLFCLAHYTALTNMCQASPSMNFFFMYLFSLNLLYHKSNINLFHLYQLEISLLIQRYTGNRVKKLQVPLPKFSFIYKYLSWRTVVKSTILQFMLKILWHLFFASQDCMYVMDCLLILKFVYHLKPYFPKVQVQYQNNSLTIKIDFMFVILFDS